MAWVTLGSLHIPHTEDIPIVTTPGVQLRFFVVPYNYFPEDPSLRSRDNIKIYPGKDGRPHYEYAGVDPDIKCSPFEYQPKNDCPASGGSVLAVVITGISGCLLHGLWEFVIFLK